MTANSVGALIHDNISGDGLRKLNHQFESKKGPKYYRIIKPFVLLIFACLNCSFCNGEISLKGLKLIMFHFCLGDEWELDEKVIPVSKRYAMRNGYHSTKMKKGRIVYQVMVLNVFDRKTHICVVSMPVGKGSIQEIKPILRIAFKRAGKKPKVIYLDRTLAHLSLADQEYLGVQFKIVDKIGTDISQVHLAEGYHKLMDRKLESGIHGLDDWLLKAVWIQYNFLEPKDDLGGRTPADVASFTSAFYALGWVDLVSVALNWSEKKEREEQAGQAQLEKQTDISIFFGPSVSASVNADQVDMEVETSIPAP